VKTGRPTTIAANGLIATPHYLATLAGVSVLQDGGSAVDAAIAANAVLTVVAPNDCSIGGDAFFLIWDPATRQLTALNGSGRSPAALTIERARAAGHETMPERGPLTVTVPGALDAWQTALQQHGRFDLGRLLGPAIRYAEDGFPMTAHFARAITTAAPLLGRDPMASRQFLPDGRKPQAGDILRQPALAASLRALQSEGVDAFYRGALGRSLIAGLAAVGGLLSEEDLRDHRTDPIRPLISRYRDVDVVELPPNTQGVTALQMLKIAEGWDIAAWGHNSAEQIHHFVEAKKLAFQDRDRYVADPDFADIPVERLIGEDYAQALRAMIDSKRASTVLPDPTGGGDTVYLCAVDRDGLAVSLIQSVFKGFGSGIVAGDTGIVLQNRGASFTLDESAANRLEPRKRPLHTLIPAMLLRGGEPWTVFGAMGGHGQAQTHLQLVSGMVDFGLEPQPAIEAPRWISGRSISDEPEHLLRVEEPVGRAVADQLSALGHEVTLVEQFASIMGHAQVIQIDQARGVLLGGADPRADGAALGW
jgi:gamma-glutamyltranspeptidase / glutathione hydrolase